MAPSPAPFWMALLPAEDQQAWHQGRLDADARDLGISGWLVPQVVTAAGTLEGLLLS